MCSSDLPRNFPPYESFPEYTKPEPEQWPVLTGTEKSFSLAGSSIIVSANLDACMQYRNYFRLSAKYYAERFRFKYEHCVQDFDSLIYYFSDMYLEGLKEMTTRAYSLFLPFGVFTVDVESFSSQHVDKMCIRDSPQGLHSFCNILKAECVIFSLYRRFVV